MRQFIIFLLFFSISAVSAQTATIINTSLDSKILFINCSNNLNVSISNFKKGDQLKYEVKGGRYIPGKTVLNPIIVPDDTLVELKIFKNNLLYTSRKFKAIKLEVPKTTLFINDTLYNYKYIYFANTVKTINLRASATEWTSSLLPNEVNYTISEFTLSLVRGKRVVMDKMMTSDFANAFEVAQNSDRYVIAIGKISRINSLRETEIINLQNPIYFTIPLN